MQGACWHVLMTCWGLTLRVIPAVGYILLIQEEMNCWKIYFNLFFAGIHAFHLSGGQTGSRCVGDMRRKSVSMEVKRRIRNSIILQTVLFIKDMDIECSTAIENTCSGNGSYKMCLWCLRMGWKHVWEAWCSHKSKWKEWIVVVA